MPAGTAAVLNGFRDVGSDLDLYSVPSVAFVSTGCLQQTPSFAQVGAKTTPSANLVP